MKLNDYLHLVDKDIETFARDIAVDPVTVGRYLNGRRRPRWEVMARIKAATMGAVTADDFLDLQPSKKRSAREASAAA